MSKTWSHMLKDQLNSVWIEISQGWNRHAWWIVMITVFTAGVLCGLNMEDM